MDNSISRQAAIDAAIKADMKNNNGILSEKRARVFDEYISNLPSAQPDCSDCIKHGGDWDCDHVHCHIGKSAQPERKKGKWMKENTRSASYIFKCSCCGKNAYFVHGKCRGRNCEDRYCGYDFCPNCGADMRGE